METKADEIYGIAVRRADQSETNLSEFAGKVLLIVNVASRCGFTPQYEGLQSIQERFRAGGFSVLGFPANEFGAQEPGTDQQIQQFCRANYGVDFPVFAKLVAKGPGRHPLYQYLTGATSKGDITWNFEKFLVGRKGEVVARFAPKVEPTDPMVVKAIEEELGK